MVRDVLASISGYPGLLAACAASGIVLPVPEDFPLMYAGIQIAEGRWGWAATLAVAMVGVSLRDVLAWSAGRLLGDWLLYRERVRRLLGVRRLDRARRLVNRHGASAVLLGRFVVGARAPVFAVAGAMGVPLRAFLVYDGLGLLVAVPLAVFLGYEFGESITGLATAVVERARLAFLVVGVVAAAWIGWRVAVSRAEVPVPGDDEQVDGSPGAPRP